MKENRDQTVILIPTYNNASTLCQVLKDVLAFSLPVYVVNDGSTDETLTLLGRFPEVKVFSYEKNRGKGSALHLGFNAAIAAGFRYAITLDSDGQHFADDIPLFLEEIHRTPDALLIGARDLTAANMPGKNTFANRFSNFWFRLETGIRLEDTQSGYRLYPLYRLKGIRLFTSRYECELELIVRAAWKGITVKNIPIRIYYPPEEERVSHFRPFRDFLRISLLNTVLVLIAFIGYWPWKFLRSFTKENIRGFISTQIIHSEESNIRIVAAVMLGVFMGIAPVWGYQMILAAILAHFMKLNKIITLVASNISIPPMIPFLLFGSYAVGGWILDRPILLSLHEVTFETVGDSFGQYLVGSLPFAAFCSLAAGMIIYLFLLIFRKPKVLL